MVDARQYLRAATVDARTDVHAFKRRLENLAADADRDLRYAARAVLRRMELSAPVTARSFDRVYYEIRHQEQMLSSDCVRAQWRAVRDTSVTLYHTLLHDFREQLKRRQVGSGVAGATNVHQAASASR